MDEVVDEVSEEVSDEVVEEVSEETVDEVVEQVSENEGKSGNWFTRLMEPILNNMGPHDRNLVLNKADNLLDQVSESVDE